MTTNGEKMTLLAEIIRLSTKGATGAEITEELSLSTAQAETYLRFLKSRRLIMPCEHGEFFPSEKGLAYLALYDGAADLADVDPPRLRPSDWHGPDGGLSWDRAELASRMMDIIER